MGKSYKNTLIGAICVAVFTTIAGLVLSYYVGIKPGGTIVLLEVVIFLILVVLRLLQEKDIKKKKSREDRCFLSETYHYEVSFSVGRQLILILV